MGREVDGIIEVVKLAEAAEILQTSVAAAERALSRAGIKSGYPRDAVAELAAERRRRAEGRSRATAES